MSKIRNKQSANKQSLSPVNDELVLARNRMMILSEKLELKEEEIAMLETLNVRFKSRLELFQRQNEENCKQAEDEIVRLAEEVESLNEIVEVCKAENAGKVEQMHRLRETLDEVVLERDEALASVRNSKKDEDYLKQLFGDSSNMSRFARLVARQDHLEVISSGFREYELQSRVFNQLRTSVQTWKKFKTLQSVVEKRMKVFHFSFIKKLAIFQMEASRLFTRSGNSVKRKSFTKWVDAWNKQNACKELLWNKKLMRNSLYSWTSKTRKLYRTSVVLRTIHSVVAFRLKLRTFTNLKSAMSSLVKQKIHFQGKCREFLHMLKTSAIKSKVERETIRDVKILKTQKSYLTWKFQHSKINEYQRRREFLGNFSRKNLVRRSFGFWKKMGKILKCGNFFMIFFRNFAYKIFKEKFINPLLTETRENRNETKHEIILSWHLCVQDEKIKKKLHVIEMKAIKALASLSVRQTWKFLVESIKTKAEESFLEKTFCERLYLRRRFRLFLSWKEVHWRAKTLQFPVVFSALEKSMTQVSALNDSLSLKSQKIVRLEKLVSEIERKFQEISESLTENQTVLYEKAARESALIEEVKHQQTMLEISRRESEEWKLRVEDLRNECIEAQSQAMKEKVKLTNFQVSFDEMVENHGRTQRAVEAEMGDKENVMDGLRARIVKLDESLCALEEKSRKENCRFLVVLQEKDAQVNQLQTQVTSFQSEMSKLKRDNEVVIKNYEEDIETLRAEIGENVLRIEDLELENVNLKVLQDKRLVEINSQRMEIQMLLNDKANIESSLTYRSPGNISLSSPILHEQEHDVDKKISELDKRFDNLESSLAAQQFSKKLP